MTRAPLAVLATAILASTIAPAAHAADASAPQGLTREQVRADLEAWQRAGLRDKFRGDGGPPFFDPDLQRRMAEYQRLKADPTPASSPAPTR